MKLALTIGRLLYLKTEPSFSSVIPLLLSTLVRLPCNTLMAAWFAGLREGSEDTLFHYEHNILGRNCNEWWQARRKHTGIRCFLLVG